MGEHSKAREESINHPEHLSFLSSHSLWGTGYPQSGLLTARWKGSNRGLSLAKLSYCQNWQIQALLSSSFRDHSKQFTNILNRNLKSSTKFNSSPLETHKMKTRLFCWQFCYTIVTHSERVSFNWIPQPQNTSRLNWQSRRNTKHHSLTGFLWWLCLLGIFFSMGGIWERNTDISKTSTGLVPYTQNNTWLIFSWKYTMHIFI